MEITGFNLKSLPKEDVEWFWKGYLGSGLLTLVASPPKAGKSTLLWELLKSMYKEEPLLGQGTKRVSTLLFTEESYATMSNRVKKLGIEDAPVHVVTIQPGLNWNTLVPYAKNAIVKHGVKLVVLDTISRFWGLNSEDDAAEQLRALAPMFVLARHYGCALLFIHHTRKSGGSEGRSVRGSNALTGAVDIILEFGRLSPYDISNNRRLSSLSRFSDTPEYLIGTLTPNGYILNADGDSETERSIITIISEREGITSAELAEELNCSERQVQRVLAQLTGRGVLVRHGSGAGKSPFSYTLAGSDGEGG